MATETMGGGNTIIIDLGLERGEPETYASPTRSTVPGWFGPLTVAVLVLLWVASSAPPPPPVLSELLSLRVGPADSYTVTGSTLVAQTAGTLTSYALADGARQWEVATPAPTYRIRIGGGLALLRPSVIGPGQPKTTAVDMATGTTRWARSGTVMTIPGSPVLLGVSGVRTIATAGRRIEGPVESVDPVSGDALWRVNVPSTAVLMSVPGPAGSPPRMLLVHDDRTMTVHDLTTGRLLASAPLQAADYGPDNPAVSGGLIVLRHSAGWESVISAYDPATLALRWRRPAGGAYEAQACGPLTCLVGPDGVQAVDPADGAIRWWQPSWRSVQPHGDLLLAYASPGGISDPVGIVDPQTGHVLVDLHGWRPLTGVGDDDEVLATRVVEAGARTIVAVARPGDAQPRLLADLPAGTGDCQSVPERLICRSASGELVVWAYREKG
jgi:outer membrane protein assembly factor BamB